MQAVKVRNGNLALILGWWRRQLKPHTHLWLVKGTHVIQVVGSGNLNLKFVQAGVGNRDGKERGNQGFQITNSNSNLGW